jgi:hypothetical protein
VAKSKAGLTLEQAPREAAFCASAILEPGALVVPGMLQDPRFAENPLVTNEPLL